jgi:hypothetical protein
MSQATIAGGRRMSTARCYLDPIRGRRNLRIETEALTERLLLDGRRCTGVRYSVADDVREACASREVVVSAGTINSPQLLELSGIGQPERLGLSNPEEDANINLVPGQQVCLKIVSLTDCISGGGKRQSSNRFERPCFYVWNIPAQVAQADVAHTPFYGGQ